MTSHNHDSTYAKLSHNHSASNITSGTLPAIRGGTGVTSINALKELLGIPNENLIIETGSYIGKNGSGNGYTNSITFSNIPILCFIVNTEPDGDGLGSFFFTICSAPYGFVPTPAGIAFGGEIAVMKQTLSGTIFSWRTESDRDDLGWYQMNGRNIEYQYCAICKK